LIGVPGRASADLPKIESQRRRDQAQQIVAWHHSQCRTEQPKRSPSGEAREAHAFGICCFEHYRSRALLYARKPNWLLIDQLTPP